jgi:hypothetical protein
MVEQSKKKPQVTIQSLSQLYNFPTTLRHQTLIYILTTTDDAPQSDMFQYYQRPQVQTPPRTYTNLMKTCRALSGCTKHKLFSLGQAFGEGSTALAGLKIRAAPKT